MERREIIEGMSNQFCRFLSNGYSFNINNVRPCCFHLDTIEFDNNINNNRDAFSSIVDWTGNCSKCMDAEMSNEVSLRQASFDILSKTGISVDISLDMTCNAACVICHSGRSTLWQKLENNLKDYTDVDDKIDLIFETVDFNKVEYIKFFGGEPLVTDTHLKVLNRIKNPEHITLQYTTNGSVVPNKEIINTWSKFKMILFTASVDGIGEQFNYIRWPLTWNKISKNLLLLRDIAPVNLLFRFEYTANFLNAFYYDDFDQWVSTYLPYNRLGDLSEIHIHRCSGIWDIRKMPIKIIKKIINKNSRISTHIKTLPAEPHALDEWWEFTNKWDTIRGNSWKTAFPDIIEYVGNNG